MSEPATAEDTALGLLSRPGFAKLLAYRIFAMLSYQVVAVTVGWHIYEVTRNPFSLGLVGLAEVLPFFCVAPFAGYLVDHLPRRRLGMVACSGLIATALVLTGVATGWLPFEGVWPIYAAIALTGMVRAFLSPIYNALFARVLARDQFARGAGLGAVVFQAGMVAGPALGGVLVGFGGKGLSYAVATAFALVAMACLATLKVEEPVHTGPAAPIFKSIAEGAIRGRQPDHGRRDGAGHVLGAAGRRGGDAAGLPARNPAPRPRRPGHPARDAGARFGVRGPVAGPPPAAPQCRPRVAVRGGGSACA